MTIEMPAREVHALAHALLAQAETADEARGYLASTGNGDLGALAVAVEAFVDDHRVAAEALAGELRWLGGTVSAVADSWLGLDEVLLAARGRAPRE
jgi:hypothetical protein